MSKKGIEAIIESTKELLRIMILAAVPVLVIGIENGQIDWKLVGTAVAIAGLRALDKLIHKSSSDEGWLKNGGLTGF